jgi:Zn-dependent protease with chaperone function
LQAAVASLWLGAVAVLLFVAGWPQIVRGNLSLAGWPLVDELAILTPVILPLVLLWAAVYRLERAAQLAACRECGHEPPPARLLSYLWLHARYHLGLVLVPALVVIGGCELLAALKLDSGSGSTAWWFGVPLAVTMLLLMPALVRRMWQTSPLPAGVLRDELTAVCRARRCGVREILVWHTGGCVANAAVVGFSSWLRYVLLTDALLARLSPPEIAAVLRHELGHLRRRHLPLRLALLAVPLAWWMAIEAAWPGAEQAAKQALATIGIPASLATAVIAPLAMLVYAVVVLGWYSRLLEHEADLEACTDDDGHFNPQATADFCRALSRLIAPEPASWFAGWLHPPLGARLAFARRCANDRVRTRFQWQLRLIAGAIGLLYFAAGVLAFV